MRRSEALAAGLLLCAIASAAIDAAGLGARPYADGGVAAPRAPRPPRRDPEGGQAIVTRALFVPTRRAEFGSAIDGAGTVGGYVLRGTLSGVAGQLAIFEPRDGGPARRLRIGNLIGGYTLAAIDAESVVLVRNGARRRIDIGDPSGPAPALREEPGGDVAPPPSPPPPVSAEVLPVITSTDPEAQ